MTDKRKLRFFGNDNESSEKKQSQKQRSERRKDRPVDLHDPDPKKAHDLSDHREKKQYEPCDNDPTIAHLARHMHRLREAVPVNQELKQQLKQKLKEELRKKKQQEKAGSGDGTHSLFSKRRMVRLVIPWMLLLFISCSVWLVFFAQERSLSVTEVVQMGEYEPQGEQHSAPVTISPSGNTVLVEQNGTIMRYQHPASEEAEVLLEADVGDFHSPSWSKQGQLAAVIYEEEVTSQVWVWSPLGNGSIRTLFQTEEELGPLYWSQDDDWLSIGKKESNGDEAETGIENETEIAYVHFNMRTGDVLTEQPIADDDGLTEHVQDREGKDPQAKDSQAKDLEVEDLNWPSSVRALIEEAEQSWLDMNHDQHSGAALIETEGRRSLLWFQAR